MSNDKGLLSGSITILIGAVIAIMALVRGPWQAWLLIGVFTLWGLWVVLILLLPYMQQANAAGSASRENAGYTLKALPRAHSRSRNWRNLFQTTCCSAMPTTGF